MTQGVHYHSRELQSNYTFGAHSGRLRDQLVGDNHTGAWAAARDSVGVFDTTLYRDVALRALSDHAAEDGAKPLFFTVSTIVSRPAFFTASAIVSFASSEASHAPWPRPSIVTTRAPRAHAPNEPNARRTASPGSL